MTFSTPFRFSGLALAVGAAGFSCNSHAQASLDPLVVTAAGYAQQVAAAPASISVISREALEDRQYRDITDALRDVPGVIVTGGGSGMDDSADISIRGMPAEYTLILVDGMPISSRETRPNGSAGYEQDWLPPLQSIERIEVIRGPMSTLYGSDAIGGVINVITRKVQDDWHANLRIGATIQEDRDSGDSQQTEFYTSGPLVENLLGLQAFGRYSTRQEDDIANGYEDKELINGTARLTLTPTESHDFMFEAGRTTQNRETSVGKSVAEGEDPDDQKHETERYSLRHEGRWGIGTSTTYVQQEKTENKTRDIAVKNLEAKTQMVMPFASHTLSIGANYSKEKLEDSTTNTISDLSELDMYQWALFVEDEYYLTETFALTAGLRMDDNENFGTHLSPRLYGVWSMTPAWTLKGGVSTGYKAPGIRDLSSEWGSISRGGTTYGNPDLEPETSVTKELALLYSDAGGFHGGITIFRNDFKDKITRVPCESATSCPAMTQYDINDDGSLNTKTRVNIDKAYTQGVELTLGAPLTKTLSFKSSYTYTDSEQESGDNKGEQLTQLPRHVLSSTLDWDPAGRFSGWSRLTFHGDEEAYTTSGRSGTREAVPSYTFVDAGGAWEITPQAKFMFGIYNLFDKDIGYDSYHYVEDGRRYWAGINLEI